jgi:hypothetical protein
MGRDDVIKMLWILFHNAPLDIQDKIGILLADDLFMLKDLPLYNPEELSQSKVDAIRAYKRRTGYSLRECKEKYEDQIKKPF